MTSTILRSTAAAIVFAGALAFATPSMAAMMTFQGRPERRERSAPEYHRRQRLGHRDL